MNRVITRRLDVVLCVMLMCDCFFFQAEDGIRDLVRSRGLGDVYKRQMYFLIGGWGYDNRVYAATKFFLFTMVGSAFMLVAVSYTHLTLPTSDLV